MPARSVRWLRGKIDRLVEDHWIGSSTKYGYFWCVCAGDFAEARRCMAGYAWPSMARLRALERHEQAFWAQGVSPVEQGDLFAQAAP